MKSTTYQTFEPTGIRTSLGPTPTGQAELFSHRTYDFQRYGDWQLFLGYTKPANWASAEAEDQALIDQANYETAVGILRTLDPKQETWWAGELPDELYDLEYVILVKPLTPAAGEAVSILDQLTQYPLICDETYSELQHEWTEVQIAKALTSRHKQDPSRIAYAQSRYWQIAREKAEDDTWPDGGDGPENWYSKGFNWVEEIIVPELDLLDLSQPETVNALESAFTQISSNIGSRCERDQLVDGYGAASQMLDVVARTNPNLAYDLRLALAEAQDAIDSIRDALEGVLE